MMFASLRRNSRPAHPFEDRRGESGTRGADRNFGAAPLQPDGRPQTVTLCGTPPKSVDERRLRDGRPAGEIAGVSRGSAHAWGPTD
jgi:hypothetical protein